MTAPKNGTPASIGHQPVWSAFPADLIDDAAQRVGTIALMFAAAWMLANLAAWLTPPERWAPGFGWTVELMMVNTASAVFSAALGVGIWALVRARRLPSRWVLLLGHLFAVAAAFGIALPTNLAATVPFGAGTWVGVWIVIFPLLVPAWPGHMLITSLASSFTSPVVAWLGYDLGYREHLDASVLAFVTVPNLICAVMAYVASRVLYRMGTDVKEARELGAYELLEQLGGGGMGEVWRAHHRMLARPAAIKIIRKDRLKTRAETTATLIRRFEREARMTARLRSPHTVQLYDFGVADDGTFYYVMELLEGLDLETLVVRFGPLPPERVVAVLRQTCNSLAEAHERGLIHRDIKPSNLLLCRLGVDYDFVKVVDFGLVMPREDLARRSGRLTQDGAIAGTPAYIAPELVTEEATADARADLYALGCCAYWMLTGRLVFERNNPVQTMLAHVESPPPPPSSRTEQPIPPPLEAIIMACLEKDPAKRPQSAKALETDLALCKLPERWTGERARRWWETYLPDVGRVQSDAYPAAKPGIDGPHLSLLVTRHSRPPLEPIRPNDPGLDSSD